MIRTALISAYAGQTLLASVAMAWNPTPIIVPLLLAAFVCAAVCVYVVRLRAGGGATALAALMACVSWWSLAYAVEISSTVFAAQLLWARFAYVGIVGIPALYLLFCTRYGQPSDEWHWPWLLLVFEPLTVLILVWMEPGLGIIWQGAESGLGLITAKAFGFWIHAVYSYGLLATGSVLLLRRLLRTGQLYRRQLVVVAVSCSVPWLANLLYLADLTPLPGFDPTPFAFTITGLGLTWGLMRHHFLSLTPLAHRLVVEYLDDGLAVVDHHERLVDVNPAAEAILGRQRSQVVGMSVQEAFGLPAAAVDPGPGRREVELLTASGPAHFEIRSIPVRGRGEGQFGRLLILHDISDTRRRQAEREALQRIRDRLWKMQKADDIDQVLAAMRRALADVPLEFAFVGINLVRHKDSTGRLTPMALDHQGRPVPIDDVRIEGGAHAVAWRSGKSLYRPDLQAEDLYDERPTLTPVYGDVRSVLDVPFDAGTLAVNSFRAHAYQPEDIALLERVAAVLSEAFLRHQDLVERERYLTDLESEIETHRKTEIALLRAKEEAESANRAKDDFIANISHELRTPVNSILGMTELVLNSDLTPTQRNYLLTANQSTQHLLGLLNTLLDFARIERQAFELEAMPFSLRQCLAAALQGLAPKAHAKGLALTFRVPVHVSDSLVGDGARLQQVLINLVGNAVKFTERGEVTVGVSVMESDEETTSLRFDVRDTGPGIEPARQEAIFEAFVQADASITRAHGGTGLGLTICRDLVHKMAGRIWVVSEPGQGSTFHFTARFRRPPPGEAGMPPLAQRVRNSRCLVIDGHEASRLAIADLLELWGVEHTDVDSPLAAVRACREGDFDILLVGATATDATQDGLDFLRQAAGDAAVIVVTTFDGLEAWTQRDGDAVTAVLVKPVSPEQLQPALEATQPEPAQAPDAAHASAPESAPAVLRVLVVDDTEANQIYARAVLQRRGHQVEIAADGQQALEVVATQGPFDVILMDLHMPRMDGIEAAAEIRRRQPDGVPAAPIIALTADVTHAGKGSHRAAGMDGFLAKPFRPPDLLRTVEEAAAEAAADKVPSRPPGAAAAPEAATLTPAQALASVEGDEELLAELGTIIQQESPGHLERVHRALAQGAASELEEATHALANLLGLLGSNHALEATRRVEEAARRGDLAAAAAAMPACEQAAARFLLDVARIAPAPSAAAGER